MCSRHAGHGLVTWPAQAQLQLVDLKGRLHACVQRSPALQPFECGYLSKHVTWTLVPACSLRSLQGCRSAS